MATSVGGGKRSASAAGLDPSQVDQTRKLIDERINELAKGAIKSPFENRLCFLSDIPELPGKFFLAGDFQGDRQIYPIGELLGNGAYAAAYKASSLDKTRHFALKIALASTEALPLENGNHLMGFEEESILSMGHELGVRVKLLKGLPPEQRLPGTLGWPVYTPQDKQPIGFLGRLFECSYADAPRTQDPSKIKKAFLSMANDLKKVHALGYTHGDVKDENFLCKNGGVHLIDFGNTQKLNEIKKKTHHGAVRPQRFTLIEDLQKEQAFVKDFKKDLKQNKPIDETLLSQLVKLREAMDVLALGTIFYRKCYNDQPFAMSDEVESDDESDEESVEGCEFSYAIEHPIAFDKNKNPIPIKERPSISLPEGLKELIFDMLNHDPYKRPSSTEVLARLQAVSWPAP